ncbi:MAG TPA: hypothetical protein VE684_16015 [Crenalkalicoccus sp.]|jgi:hypothetical protein|nr:hypothetical protein [Crenalkalicoccus sp.]
MPKVILVLAGGPGLPGGSPDHRYELTVTLDANGCLDAVAWAADPAPWTALRFRPDAPTRPGEVVHDAETGWQLRFPEGGQEIGLPVALSSGGPLRPGAHVTLREPGGEYAYRVVSVG